jgi:hypothetical protein
MIPRRRPMPLPEVPNWLEKRDGSLKPGVRDHIVLVVIGGEPLYKLEVRPAGGKHSCYVSQTNNGRRLDDGTTYHDRATAFAGGLDQLRNRLGW